ncbi:CaiB/BaiF CoA-transferase family protein [Actinomadura algeriensis]|uniref:Crotonobetainyl-CoA:carnitine CoA-transferase CaiB-like acyl-CoA transferase n=1 Tax=Actinomadura algeriensis TaxID=1679523 RepID=A0ABR9K2A7_9ACTN|nr:CoA transferase [Actinomadura algeriensis]MBE1536963.1 crotonobetainyl-CoA:carnitine CoA-transferase CaiB-like acyl-CoA transferase [Actinomadura algeriensis]
MLEHLRVLDLTDERGLVCGRLLADLGADVVQVEPPHGSTARSAPPVAAAGPSLFWECYAAGKRGVAADLDDEAGLATVRDLAARADVLVTSLPLDRLRERGLDPETMRAAHPSLVYTAISAFGLSGPKSGYADGDLVVWAAGGPLDPHRDGDRPPLRISVPQAFLQAGADAAAGTLLAVLARDAVGGQLVDVSAQASLGVATLGRVLAHAVGDENPEWHRQPAGRSDQSGSGAATPNSMKKWHVKDGMVELHLSMGPAAGAFTNNLFGWLRDERAVEERIASWDWRTIPDHIADGTLERADLDAARAAVGAFLRDRTKAEVLDAAIRYRLLCVPILDVADIAGSAHLAARDHWAEVDIEGRTVRIPGRIAHATVDPPAVRRPAPRIGEHTAKVVRDWTRRPASAFRDDAPGATGVVVEAQPGDCSVAAGVGGSGVSWVAGDASEAARGRAADARTAVAAAGAPGLQGAEHASAEARESGRERSRGTGGAGPGPRRRDGRAVRALDGLKVLDLSWVVAGPLIGRALADFGACVVRAESATRVETARLMQPFAGGVPGKENSALFGNCNAGKLGLTVDLNSEDGRSVVRDLARWADVVVESFSPGRMAKWGLDYASLAADNPSVIMLSTSIAGQSGPWAGLAGFGNVGSSLSGFQGLAGWPDRLPLGPFGPYTDYLGPRLALAALLAAVEDRRRTGRGRHIDVAQIEAGVFFLSPQIAHYGFDGTIARRRGNRDEALVPHGVFRCLPEDAERFVAVAARTDEEWRRLAAAIGRADLAERDDLATVEGRRAAETEIEEAIGAWTAGRRAAEAEELLQAAGVPAHRSQSSADFARDPQLAARGHLVALDHPLHGTTYVEGPRYLLSETPGAVERAAPTLGRDNETVLRDVLGYPESRVRELLEGGALR